MSPYMDPDDPLVQLGYYYEMDYDSTFTAKGTECPDNNFYFSVFAKKSDGQKLNPDYLSFTIPKQSTQIRIEMNTAAFPDYDGEAHAVYVEAQHPTDYRAKNWYCFMITNCPEENLDCSGARNLCEPYCRVAR